MGLWPFKICAAFCSYDVGAGAGGVVLPAFSLGIVGRGQRLMQRTELACARRGAASLCRATRFAHGNHKAQTNMEGAP